MRCLQLFLFCGIFGFARVNCHTGKVQKQNPHIIVILADDLGWDDISCHNSNLFTTPNIDSLFYNGISIHDFHSASLCTPSRSALMTGHFPIRIGMQRSVILEAEPWGLPTWLKILPQYLKYAGYVSHLLGKWHLGFFDKAYTPIKRGFDSFFGGLQGHHNYFTQDCHETFDCFNGYDLNENLKPRKDLKGFYASDLLNDEAARIVSNHDSSKPLFLLLNHFAPHAGEVSSPLQAPDDVIKRYSYIPEKDKRVYAAMVSKLDEGVGKVMNALSKKKMLENSVVMFMSDNGAPTIGIYNTTGRNYPLRGMKNTEFEGGTRLPAAIWSPLFKKHQFVSKMLMHMVDVLPTLCTAAGLHPKHFDHIDGISMWETLVEGLQESPRTEFPYGIDPAEPNHSVGAVRVGDWKFYQGDANGTSEMFLYPANKYPNSLYEKFGYDTSEILQSPTNKAIEKVYLDSKIPHRPLTAKKIKQLRSEMKIVCPTFDHLPKCDATKSCLLNMKEDPCEQYDYSTHNPRIYRILKQKYEEYRRRVVPPRNKPRDVCANPEYYDGVWVPWYNYDNVLRNLTALGLKCSKKL